MISLLMFAALVSVDPHAYFASSVSTQALAQICAEKSATDLGADFCTGYVTAVYDTLSINHLICPSAGASTVQLVAVARKYLAEHPEQWDKQPAFVLSLAFKAAFPCH